MEGLTEETVSIGDIYQVGEAVVQVAQPRVPCFKTSLKHGAPDMIERITGSGYTGFYFRLLTEGHVTAGDELTLLKRAENAPSVAFANRIRHHETENMEGLRMLLAAEGLAEVWRETLSKRLA